MANMSCSGRPRRNVGYRAERNWPWTGDYFGVGRAGGPMEVRDWSRGMSGWRQVSRDWSTGRKNSGHSDPGKQSPWFRFKDVGKMMVVVWALSGKAWVLRCPVMVSWHSMVSNWPGVLKGRESKSENKLNLHFWSVWWWFCFPNSQWRSK